MAAVQIGNREKIAAIIIACLVAIGAVHWFVFMARAHSYAQAYQNYQMQLGSWTQLVSSTQEPQIQAMIKQTQLTEDMFDELARDLNVNWDPIFFDKSKEGVKKCQDRLIAAIQQVIEMRTKNPKIRLTFMDWHPTQMDPFRPTQPDPGWDIPTALPTGIPLWDIVDRLQNTARTMRVLKDPIQKLLARDEYNKNLIALGINPVFLDPQMPTSLGNLYGDLIPLIKRFAHAQLIWAQKQKDEKTGVSRFPINTLDDLYLLMEIKVPNKTDDLFRQIKQLQLLLRLVKLAEDNSVEEIGSVVLLPKRKIDIAPNEENQPRMVPEQHYDHFFLLEMGYPPGSLFGPGGPFTPGGGAGPTWTRPRPQVPEGGDGEVDVNAAARTPAAPGRGGPGAIGPGGAATAEEEEGLPEPVPVPGGTWMGDAMPIRVRFLAPWDTALNFVYVISHNRNPFGVDAWEMRTVQGGKIQSETTLAPIVWIAGLDMFYAPATTATVTAATGRASPAGGAATVPAGPPGQPTPAAPTPSRLGARRTPDIE